MNEWKPLPCTQPRGHTAVSHAAPTHPAEHVQFCAADEKCPLTHAASQAAPIRRVIENKQSTRIGA